jgi:hypothetical protein
MKILPLMIMNLEKKTKIANTMSWIAQQQVQLTTRTKNIQSIELMEAMVSEAMGAIGRPTLSVAQANLTIKINFNVLHSFSSFNILTIYVHAFLQSLHLFEKNCVQGLPRDFRQNKPNTSKKFTWSVSAISRQLSFDVGKKEKVRGCQILRIRG